MNSDVINVPMCLLGSCVPSFKKLHRFLCLFLNWVVSLLWNCLGLLYILDTNPHQMCNLSRVLHLDSIHVVSLNSSFVMQFDLDTNVWAQNTLRIKLLVYCLHEGSTTHSGIIPSLDTGVTAWSCLGSQSGFLMPKLCPASAANCAIHPPLTYLYLYQCEFHVLKFQLHITYMLKTPMMFTFPSNSKNHLSGLQSLSGQLPPSLTPVSVSPLLTVLWSGECPIALPRQHLPEACYSHRCLCLCLCLAGSSPNAWVYSQLLGFFPEHSLWALSPSADSNLSSLIFQNAFPYFLLLFFP